MPLSSSLAGLLLALALVLTAHQELRADSQPDEYRVKAAYLYHFAQLVEWPSGAFSRDDRSLFICTFGDDPFHGALDTAIEGKVIGGRSVRVRHIHGKESSDGCQMLFIGRDASNWAPSLLADLRDSPIVTVGEEENFLREGGIVRFVLENNTVRFVINLPAADSARVKISSRLLLLAKYVIRSMEAR